MSESFVKTYKYDNGEIQRVQVVTEDSFDKLHFFVPTPSPLAFTKIVNLYRNFIVPRCPWVFGRMLLVSLDKSETGIGTESKLNDGSPVRSEARNGTESKLNDGSPVRNEARDETESKLNDGSPVRNEAGIGTEVCELLRKSVRIDCRGQLHFSNEEARRVCGELEKKGSLAVVCGKLPHTKILPVGNSLGFMSESLPEAKVKVNSNFFVMDCFDVASPVDRIGAPIGLMVKDGKVINPPAYDREAFLVSDSTENSDLRSSEASVENRDLRSSEMSVENRDLRSSEMSVENRDLRSSETSVENRDLRSSEMSVEIRNLRLSELSVIIKGCEFKHGVNATIYERPKTCRIPRIARGKFLTIVGCRVVAVYEKGGFEVPSSGFVLKLSEGIDGKGIDGKEIDGKEIDGKEIDGKEIGGKEIDGKGIDGKEIGGNGIGGKGTARKRTGGNGIGCKEIGDKGITRKEIDGEVRVGDIVEYKGLENVKFGVQVGNSAIINGKQTKGFTSKFYNIFRHFGAKAYPPSLYPLDYDKARAPRIAIGATRDGKPCIIWAEGSKKTGYVPGEQSCGASLSEMATIAEDLGIYNAVNLDGGGSAQILIDNKRSLIISDRNPENDTDAERAVPAGIYIE